MSIDEIKMLDITERIILVEEIWDSIAKDQDNVGLSEYEKEILDIRLTSLQHNSDNLMSWDEIKNKIRS
jgi:putative addiction module component (TIGR02574 family)